MSDLWWQRCPAPLIISLSLFLCIVSSSVSVFSPLVAKWRPCFVQTVQNTSLLFYLVGCIILVLSFREFKLRELRELEDDTISRLIKHDFFFFLSCLLLRSVQIVNKHSVEQIVCVLLSRCSGDGCASSGFLVSFSIFVPISATRQRNFFTLGTNIRLESKMSSYYIFVVIGERSRSPCCPSLNSLLLHALQSMHFSSN